jgi:hypothetical protein
MMQSQVVQCDDTSQHDVQQDCGGWDMFGDQTWCKKAMRERHGIIALSFGIEERDLYSEYMSRVYQDRL